MNPMKPKTTTLKMPLLTLLLSFTIFCSAQDKIGCENTEPAYLNRLPGFHISDCEESEFKDHTFIYYNGSPAKSNKLNKGGKYHRFTYFKNTGETRKFSSSQIIENYTNAILKVKGKVLSNDKTMLTASLNEKEVYVQLSAGNSADVKNFIVTILEVELMKQDIEVKLKEAIEKEGKIALYGILFDVNKSIIKPESEKALQAVIDYLKANPSEKIIIVGHTDNTGIFTNNITLSKERAKAVKEYVITKGIIDANRLLSDGVGSLCPVATNTTEDGKALNRRVELVRQ